MRKTFLLALLLVSFSSFADVLRSDKHLVKIEPQGGSDASRQYNVQVFDAESRGPIAHLKVTTKGDMPGEDESVASGVRYVVRIEPHGDAYLIAFRAEDGDGLVDAMRGGFTTKTKPQATPGRAARGGRDVNEPAVLRRVEPVYTDEAKAAGAAGTVVVEAVIDRSGFVRDATVIKPMGYGLSESAVDAVKQWQFAPTMDGRAPIEVVQEVTLEFKP